MPYVYYDNSSDALVYATMTSSKIIGPGLIPISIRTSLQERGLDYYTLEAHVRAGQFSTFEISSEQLADADQLQVALTKNSVLINSQYKSYVQGYLMEEFRNMLHSGGYETLTTTNLGWHYLSFVTKPVFILENKNVNGLNIEYVGTSMSFKAGTYIGQLKFIKDEVLPYKETQLALAMGLSSIVSSLVNSKREIGTLVVNVSGSSSTGKSTMAQLSASLYGSPVTSNFGLVRTFNATKNSILAMCEGRNGLPIILDDANANAKEHNKSDLIYQLAMGEARARCNNVGNNLAQRERLEWNCDNYIRIFIIR